MTLTTLLHLKMDSNCISIISHHIQSHLCLSLPCACDCAHHLTPLLNAIMCSQYGQT